MSRIKVISFIELIISFYANKHVCKASISVGENSLNIENSEFIFNSSIVLYRINKQFRLLKHIRHVRIEELAAFRKRSFATIKFFNMIGLHLDPVELRAIILKNFTTVAKLFFLLNATIYSNPQNSNIYCVFIKKKKLTFYVIHNCIKYIFFISDVQCNSRYNLLIVAFILI